MTSPQEYVQTHFDAFRQQLNELLRIRSVSTSPQFAGEVKRAAAWVAADMRRIGLEQVAVEPTAGHPIVYGEWLGAGANAPTVLVYGHYDVQPAARQDGWDSDPDAVGEST